MRVLATVLIAFLAINSTAISKTKRSQSAKIEFKRENPCPATGAPKEPCKGWVIDHIKPLACNGADHKSNMQWQTKEDAKAKDKWERKGCRPVIDKGN